MSDDDAIRERVIAELSKQPWAPLLPEVIVTNGHVKLVGTIFDDRQREAIRVVAENVPGVNNIEDQLIWIEPMERNGHQTCGCLTNACICNERIGEKQ